MSPDEEYIVFALVLLIRNGWLSSALALGHIACNASDSASPLSTHPY